MNIPALHWFTSDLRLGDNPALAAAGGQGMLAGVFVLDPASLRRAADAPRRVAFLRACVASLDASLRARGSRLIVAEGDPADVLPRIAARLGARTLTHARNYEPAAKTRERRVAATLARDGVACDGRDAACVHPPGTLRTGTGTPFLVYGAFARAWTSRVVAAGAKPPPRWAPAAALAGLGTAIDASDDDGAGEAAAVRRLAAFVRHSLSDYAEQRDVPGVDGTSRLSFHLRFGAVSAVTAVRRVRAAAASDPAKRRGADAWLRELAWRDFFYHLLDAFPRVVREPFRPLPVRWRIDDRALRAWQDGMTGYPFVDAGMRQLAATGWMHNRARMTTASFLTRHLLLDWRDGERHFMALLLDGHVAQNDGNWQWVAGTGADAQPPYRILSPVRQGERFDPDGTYVRRWIPELARVPDQQVHQPWRLTPIERRTLCPDYPPPIVDLDEARSRAQAAIERAQHSREASRGRSQYPERSRSGARD